MQLIRAYIQSQDRNFLKKSNNAVAISVTEQFCVIITEDDDTTIALVVVVVIVVSTI